MAKTIFFARRFAAAGTTTLLALASASAFAQAALEPVTVTGKAPVAASVAGWDDVPLERAPLQATSVDAERMRDAGARRLSDLVRFDPAVNSAYDTESYIDYFCETKDAEFRSFHAEISDWELRKYLTLF